MTNAVPLGEVVDRLLCRVATHRPVGVDAVHIETWRRHLQVAGEPLLRAIYRQSELEFCAGRDDRLASRLAGKEAVLKVLGTGVRGIALRDVEILKAPGGQPSVRLHGPAARRAAALGLTGIEVSLCHEHDYALAVAAGCAGGGV